MITAHPRHPAACSWRPAHDLPDDERARLLSTIRACADHIAKQEVIVESLALLNEWALGVGPLPVDEEAERAAWGYLRAAVEALGVRGAAPFFVRVKGLLLTRCPDAFEEPTMPWSEAVRRLREAAELRVALGRIKLASRRALAGDRIGTIRALRGAVDVFGEPKASTPVELQWRVAELEAELAELRALRGP